MHALYQCFKSSAIHYLTYIHVAEKGKYQYLRGCKTYEGFYYSIISSPLLTRFISSKPSFLKIDWSATGMGYNLIQPDDNTEARTATSKLLNRGECDFDLSSDGARLRHVLFNIRSYTATDKHYHGFVG